MRDDPRRGPLPVPDDHLQMLEQRLGSRALSDIESGTIIVLPSLSFPPEELRKIVGIEHYEERMLFMALVLRKPKVRLVYLSSMPIDPAVVDYYLSFLPDPASARARLRLISTDDPTPRALSEKLLERPDLIAELRDLVDSSGDAYVLPFNVTALEDELARTLDAPLYGPRLDLTVFGSKSGARRVAREARVPMVDGAENLFSMEELEDAVARLRQRPGGVQAVVVKLNEGFSGQGNAIVELGQDHTPLTQARTSFCAQEESWPSFATKIAREGGVVEELVRGAGFTSPSVQVRISPDGSFEVVSTHDQVLGGPDDQVYLGCHFPARPEYRLLIQDHARAVAKVLAAEGVIGPFGIDFIVVPSAAGPRIYLSEINLRMGGTSHPFYMSRLVTGGHYDETTGNLLVNGKPVAYVSSDNVKSERYIGLRPAQVVDALERSGRAYDRSRGSGATLHLLGAVTRYGKLGMTCIGPDLPSAAALFDEAVAVIDDLAAT